MASIDLKLGLRMLLKYPGLTVAGGLTLAIAIGIGAAWHEVSGTLLRPSIPLPDGDRFVEIEMRNARVAGDERRVLHDFLIWRSDLRSVEELGAYRTTQRRVSIDGSTPAPVEVAEISASAFRLVHVPPLLGRPLLETDEEPGAPDVVVIGHQVWQQRFGANADIVGRTVLLGDAPSTIVGVMPEGFAFPMNHSWWVPLRLSPAGYAPLGGPPVRIFGRIAAGATQAQANAEVTTITQRIASTSPETHAPLRPRVRAYGGESPGDIGVIEFVARHGPVLLVLIVACMNVATLIYARTATREGEIALRHGLGAGRGRIVSQLFVEALVLAAFAALLGLSAAHAAVTWGMTAFYSSMSGGMPFWIHPGLRGETVLYAIGLAVAGAAVLGVLPALKATGSSLHMRLRDVGAGSTLRFGGIWTTALVGQVAITVICMGPAAGISSETWDDRQMRSQFPGQEYLAVRTTVDQDLARGESDEAFAQRRSRLFDELERRLREEPGVRAITFADALPGMDLLTRRGEFEAADGGPPVPVPLLWSSTVAPTFFEAFDRPIVAGRGFSSVDQTPGARAAIVNEAFARIYTNGSSPLGRRIRYATPDASAAPEPWFEIVGVAKDIGMTPTDTYDGEGPNLYLPWKPGAPGSTMIAVRTTGDRAALAERVRRVALDLGDSFRIEELRGLDEWIWRVDLPGVIAAGAVVTVVGLGLFMSAAAIFSLMSVTVARRTREIGLRAALGAGKGRLIASIFSRAAMLVGGGILAANVFVVFVVWLSDGDVATLAAFMVQISAVMLAVALLACVAPARRALSIDPATALRDM